MPPPKSGSDAADHMVTFILTTRLQLHLKAWHQCRMLAHQMSVGSSKIRASCLMDFNLYLTQTRHRVTFGDFSTNFLRRPRNLCQSSFSIVSFLIAFIGFFNTAISKYLKGEKRERKLYFPAILYFCVVINFPSQYREDLKSNVTLLYSFL